jgi:hypothetical protein
MLQRWVVASLVDKTRRLSPSGLADFCQLHRVGEVPKVELYPLEGQRYRSRVMGLMSSRIKKCVCAFVPAEDARKMICSRDLCGPIRQSRCQLASLSHLDACFRWDRCE